MYADPRGNFGSEARLRVDTEAQTRVQKIFKNFKASSEASVRTSEIFVRVYKCCVHESSLALTPRGDKRITRCQLLCLLNQAMPSFLTLEILVSNVV